MGIPKKKKKKKEISLREGKKKESSRTRYPKFIKKVNRIHGWIITTSRDQNKNVSTPFYFLSKAIFS